MVWRRGRLGGGRAMTPAQPAGCPPATPPTARCRGCPTLRRGACGGGSPQRALLSDVAGRPRRHRRALTTRRGRSPRGLPPPPRCPSGLTGGIPPPLPPDDNACALQEGCCRGEQGRSPALPLSCYASPPAQASRRPANPPPPAHSVPPCTCTGGSSCPSPLPIDAASFPPLPPHPPNPERVPGRQCPTAPRPLHRFCQQHDPCRAVASTARHCHDPRCRSRRRRRGCRPPCRWRCRRWRCRRWLCRHPRRRPRRPALGVTPSSPTRRRDQRRPAHLPPPPTPRRVGWLAPRPCCRSPPLAALCRHCLAGWRVCVGRPRRGTRA